MSTVPINTQAQVTSENRNETRPPVAQQQLPTENVP